MAIIVDVLHPTNWAMMGIGIPALIILVTAVCLKSWNRHASGWTPFVLSGLPARIHPAFSLAVFQARLTVATGMLG